MERNSRAHIGPNWLTCFLAAGAVLSVTAPCVTADDRRAPAPSSWSVSPAAAAAGARVPQTVMPPPATVLPAESKSTAKSAPVQMEAPALPAITSMPAPKTIKVVEYNGVPVPTGVLMQPNPPQVPTPTVPVSHHTTVISEHQTVYPVESHAHECGSCNERGCWSDCKANMRSAWACRKAPATAPPPLGLTTRSVFSMQRAAALAEYSVLYRGDWKPNSATLNATGQRHLDGIVRRMAMSGSMVKVEPSGNSDLDDQRVAATINALCHYGMSPSEAASLVMPCNIRSEGLRDVDIESIPRPNMGAFRK